MIAANPFRCDLSRSKGLHVLLMKIDKTLDPCTIHSLAFQLKRFCFEFSMDLISTSSMRSMDYTSSPKLKRNSTPSLKFWTIPEKILSMTLTIPILIPNSCTYQEIGCPTSCVGKLRAVFHHQSQLRSKTLPSLGNIQIQPPHGSLVE